MNSNRKTIIQPQVFIDVELSYNYIKQNSPQNAEKFKKKIAKSIEKVELNPLGYPAELYLNTSDKIIYRFIVVMKSWKLIFKTSENYLIFVSCIHSATNYLKKK